MLGLIVIVVAAAVAVRDATLRPGTTRYRHRARNVGTRRRHPARARASHGQEHSPRRIELLPGQVVDVDVDVGARLEGQVIARLDNAEQKAAAVGAGSQLASAQLLGLRAEKAFMDILQAQRAKTCFRDARSGRAARRQGRRCAARLLHTETEIARRAAALSLAQRLVARRLIRAPMAGVVLERNVAAGESLPASPPGPPLFVIGSDPAWRWRSTNATPAGSCPARRCSPPRPTGRTIFRDDSRGDFGARRHRGARGPTWSCWTSPIPTGRCVRACRRPWIFPCHRPRRAGGAERRATPTPAGIGGAANGATKLALVADERGRPGRSPSQSVSRTKSSRK